MRKSLLDQAATTMVVLTALMVLPPGNSVQIVRKGKVDGGDVTRTAQWVFPWANSFQQPNSNVASIGD